MLDTTKAQGLAAAKTGGKVSAARRCEQVAKLAAFRAHLEGLTDTPDPIRQALIDSAASLYAVILRRSSMSGGVNPKVNMLALSACITGLKGLLRELGVLGMESSEKDLVPTVAQYIASRARPELEDEP